VLTWPVTCTPRPVTTTRRASCAARRRARSRRPRGCSARPRPVARSVEQPECGPGSVGGAQRQPVTGSQFEVQPLLVGVAADDFDDTLGVRARFAIRAVPLVRIHDLLVRLVRADLVDDDSAWPRGPWVLAGAEVVTERVVVAHLHTGARCVHGH
jgi:hypothetical protein